jgi:signal transduction histidine kinase
MLAASLFVPAIASTYAARGQAPPEIAPELQLALLFAGAWISGDRTRLRGLQVGELRQRARRAELEAERERRLAAAEERTRIARELHDSAGHAITVILVQAGAARLLHARDPAGSQRAISTIEAVARDTIGKIDRLVRALRHDDGRDPRPPTRPRSRTCWNATARAVCESRRS